MSGSRYKILHVEDDPKDAELVAVSLADQVWFADILQVTDKEACAEQLAINQFDAVLIDYSIVHGNVLEALSVVRMYSENLPIIIVSGAIGEEKAVELLRQGATDYVLKDNLKRLPVVIERAVKECRLKQKQKELESSYQKFSESSPVGFYKMDSEGKCSYVDDSILNMFGCTPEELLDSAWLWCIDSEYKERVLEEWKEATEKQIDFEMEMPVLRKDGTKLWVVTRARPERNGSGVFQGHFGTIIDVTKLKETEFRLQELSYYDILTNLPNRRFFQESLQKTLSRAKRYNEKFALFYIDIDEFKKINDTKGHNFGDKFLFEVGRRFRNILRENDFVSRIGGDEFAVIVDKYTHDNDVILAAERILEALRKPYNVDGDMIYSSISIGIAIYPDAGETAENLLQHADVALYRAKVLGRNRYQFYNEMIQRKLDKQVKIENFLEEAIQKKELYLVYQPQVDSITKRMVGYEVLLRWNNPIFGEILPDQFIPIAEKSGHMPVIGMWTLEMALKKQKEWENLFSEKDMQSFIASINISPTQILKNRISKEFIKKIKDANIKPRSIMFEITETAYMDNPALLSEVLKELKLFGISIAIDDFGTGYSSLSVIDKLPVDFIKIDANFVQNMFDEAKNIPIIKAIVDLSKNLNFKVVAEGVETQRQAEVLTQIGCDYLQGFYFSKPLKADEMEYYIRNSINEIKKV